MKRLLLHIAIFFAPVSALAQFVVLNEYGVENDRITWVELYNPLEEESSLNGWSIAIGDSLIHSLAGVTVEAQSYAVVNLQGSNFELPKDLYSFAIESEQEIVVYNNNGQPMTSLDLVCMPEGYSYGANSGWPQQVHFTTKTPGTENSNAIDLSRQHLSFEGPEHISNESNFVIAEGASIEHVIRYDMAGNLIHKGSALWPNEGVTLDASNINNTELSLIPASGIYLPPVGEQDQAHTITIQSYHNGCPTSTSERKTFLVELGNENPYDLPVVAITTEDDNLFGDSGIYGYGETGNNFAFRGRKWEREATIQYFDEDGKELLHQNVGLRIRGNSSRFSPQKSFKIYARNSHGEGWLDNVFFPESGVEELKRFNLRTPHNDFIRSLTTDHISMNAVGDLNIDAPDSKQVIVFLNGEFWGLYALQEAMDDYFPESHYGVNDNDVSLIEDGEYGERYASILRYAKDKDLTIRENYEYLTSHFDMPSLIDYYAAQIIVANWDWPYKNVKMWYKEDLGKIRYYFFDCDACLNEVNHSTLEQFYPEINTSSSRVIFSRLLQVQEFRQQFGARLISILNNQMSVENLLELTRQEKLRIEPIVSRQISRWRYPQSYSIWEASTESIEYFLIERQLEMIHIIEQMMNEDLMVYPNPAAPNSILNVKSYGMLSEQFDYEITDLSGRIVQQGSGYNEQLDIRGLSTGLFVLRVEKDGYLLSSRFVVR